MATDELITERPTGSTDWAEAFHNYEREQAAYAVVAAEYEAACAEYHRMVPDDSGADFEPYRLSLASGTDRQHLIVVAEGYIIVRDFKSERLTPEELARVRVEAARVVDNFLEWRAVRTAAHEKASVLYDPAEEKHDAACGKLANARNKLLSTPAPDSEAMLFKLDLLASIMAEAGEQDAPHVKLIADDAHRLFGRA